MSEDLRRVTMDINKKLWHEVGIESAKLGITKREFTTEALKEKIRNINKEENHSE